MGIVNDIEKILKQNNRKFTGTYKRYLGTLSKPALLQIYAKFKSEVEAWQLAQSVEARTLEAMQAMQAAIELIPASKSTRKIKLRKPSNTAGSIST